MLGAAAGVLVVAADVVVVADRLGDAPGVAARAVLDLFDDVLELLQFGVELADQPGLLLAAVGVEPLGDRLGVRRRGACRAAWSTDWSDSGGSGRPARGP